MFYPVVAEPSGGWGENALLVIQAIAKAGAARSGLDAGRLKTQYLEGLSVAIRRAVARAVLQRGATSVIDANGCHGLLDGVETELQAMDGM